MVKKLPKTMSEKEFMEIVRKVPKKHTHIRLAFMLGFYQCMRVSEVVKITPENVDRDRGFLHIINAKGGKDRDVPIMEPVKAGLKHLPVGVGARALQMQLRKYAPQFHFHSLRHSGATFYLNEKKIGIRHIQQLLGHSRLDTTMIYTHVTSDNLKETFGALW